MKLNGKISFFINKGQTTIEIEDDKANVRFVTVTLNDQQLVALLSRQAMVDCELEVVGVDKVGKVHENNTFEFDITGIKFEGLSSEGKTKILTSMAQEVINKKNEGWIVDAYFGSQTSFFTKEGKNYARCIIRRYI